MAGGVVEFPGGQVLHSRVIPTEPLRGGELVLQSALALAAELIEQARAARHPVLALGVDVCELVDLRGNITSDKTIKWIGTDVRGRFSRLLPTVVEADIRAAAFAESYFGAGRPYRLFVYVSVGTGISYSLVQDSKPYAGARGNAMLFANTPLTMMSGEPGAPSAPQLEDLASGPGLVALYNRDNKHQLTRAEEIFSAADQGNPKAVQVLEQGGELLGRGVGFLINVLDPEAVIVGGGLGLTGGIYWREFVTSARRLVWSDTNRDIPILPAALGPDSAMIGAAAVAWQKFSTGALAAQSHRNG